MVNVKYEIVDDELILRVNIKERHGPSNSGKTIMIATSGGNIEAGKGGIKFGLNVFVSKPNS